MNKLQRRHFSSIAIPSAILIFLGLIMIFSTSPTVGLSNYNDPYFFIKRHLIYLFLGSFALLITVKIPHQLYRKLLIPGFFLSILCLIFTLIPPFGVSIGGASRWLNLGVQFQPIELVKFWFIVYLATFFDRKSSDITSFTKGILPLLIVLCVPLLILALQPDLGNTLVMVGVLFVLLFINRAAVWQILTLMASGAALVMLSILSRGYQRKRIRAFLDPWADPLGESYHIIQSFIAIGSGGLWGKGLGEGQLKFFYLPLHYSDFIFSIAGEEGGFLLAALIVALFTILIIAGLNLSQKLKDNYAKNLALGLILFICLQAFINIACVIGLLPVTGIPLTFISYGGSSLVLSMAYIGVVLNIAKGGKP
jgi:cell division protein FtsW